ncbi:hypothetical protein Tco_1075258 [Tanacetum coccineum]
MGSGRSCTTELVGIAGGIISGQGNDTLYERRHIPKKWRVLHVVHVFEMDRGEVLSGPSDLSGLRGKSNHGFLGVDSEGGIPHVVALFSEHRS